MGENTKAGYQEYLIEPELGGLEWMKGKVPTPNGDIEVDVSRTKLKITTAAKGSGSLRFKSSKMPRAKGATVGRVSAGLYEVLLSPGKTYDIDYQLPGK